MNHVLIAPENTPVTQVLDKDDFASSDKRAATRETPPPRVQQWAHQLIKSAVGDALLDLSKAALAVDFIVPDGMLPGISDALQQGERFHCLDAARSSVPCGLLGRIDPEYARIRFACDYEVFAEGEGLASPAVARACLEAEQNERSTGSKCLYLALGRLVGQADSGSRFRAPLFFLPVTLKSGGGAVDLALEGGDLALPNHYLRETLTRMYGLKLNVLKRPYGVDAPLRIGALISGFRAALRETGLSFAVEEGVSLVVLPLADMLIREDIMRGWNRFFDNPIVRHLAEKPGETFVQDRLPIGGDGALPVEALQHRAVAAAMAETNFVLKVAPGCDQTQSVVNLVREALEADKSVLVVANEASVLEDVARNLDDVSPTQTGQASARDFTLEVHARSAGMKNIRPQLKRALRAQAGGEDGAIAAALRVIRAHPDNAQVTSQTGLSLLTACEMLLRLGEGGSWQLAPDEISVINQSALEAALDEGTRLLNEIGQDEYDAWLIVGDAKAKIDGDAAARAAMRLGGLRIKLANLPRGWPEALREARPGKTLTALNQAIVRMQSDLLPGKAMFAEISRQTWQAQTLALREQIVAFQSEMAEVLAEVAPGLVDSPFLNEWVAGAARFGKLPFLVAEPWRKPVRDAVRSLVSPRTNLRGLQLVTALENANKVRVRALDLRSRAMALAGLMLPANWAAYRAGALEAFDLARQSALDAVWLEKQAPTCWLKLQEPLDNSEIETLKEIELGWNRWLETVGATERSIEQWLGQRDWLRAWDEDTLTWANELSVLGQPALSRHRSLADVLLRLDAAGGRDLANRLVHAEFELEEAKNVMLRGLAHASLNECLAKLSMSEADDSAGGLSQRANPVVCDEGTTSEFRRQLDQARGGSLPELVEHFPQMIRGLQPVMLMSPGAVAETLGERMPRFDLAVFAGAARITLAESVGAMGRAKTLVLIDDSMELLSVAQGESLLAAALAADFPVLHLDETQQPEVPPAIVLPDFIPASTAVVGDCALFGDLDAARQQIVAYAVEAMCVEGPIQLDRLARIIYRRYGVTRVGARKLESMNILLAWELDVDEDRFAWPASVDSRHWPDARRTVSTADRAFAEISLAELNNTLELIVRQQPGMDRRLLMKTAVELLGYEKLTVTARRRLAKALDDSLEKGRFVEVEGRVQCSGADA